LESAKNLQISHNSEKKNEIHEGLKVLENALHVSAKAKSAENSAHKKPALVMACLSSLSIFFFNNPRTLRNPCGEKIFSTVGSSAFA
jgi:hypothetical protein